MASTKRRAAPGAREAARIAKAHALSKDERAMLVGAVDMVSKHGPGSGVSPQNDAGAKAARSLVVRGYLQLVGWAGDTVRSAPIFEITPRGRAALASAPRRPGVRRRAAPVVFVPPEGYGREETGKKRGQLRMFNPAVGKTGHARSVHVWLPYIVDGRPSKLLKSKTELRSGAYAIRRKDSHGVVYVGESRQGHMWRTIARHFQSPETFTNPKKPGGANSFATDRPGDYEVTVHVTSKGYRTKDKSDQKALNLQAEWIRNFKAKHPRSLKNKDDGRSSASLGREFRAHRASQAAESSDREWFENPAPGSVTALGLLTRLELASGVVLAWSMRDAPVLAYDSDGRLLVTYPGRVVRASLPAELQEYERSHWGATPAGKVRNSGVAVPPWKQLGAAVHITYTTRKGSDSALVDYVHPFEKRLPRVVEHQCKGGCAKRCGAAGSIALVGGDYTMTVHGIVG